MSNSPVPLFVSHAGADKDLADSLVALLYKALDLRTADIRYTSSPDSGIGAGENIESVLASEARDCTALLAIITSASMDSKYVLFELGARWCVGRPLFPLLCCGADHTIMPGPISGRKSITCDREGLQRLLEDLAGALGKSVEPLEACESHIEAVLSANQNLLTKRTRSPHLGRPSCLDLFTSRTEHLTSLKNTPYDFFTMLKDAEWESVWMISQNLGGLLANDIAAQKLTAAVVGALETKEVGIMVSTPEMMYDDGRPDNDYRARLLQFTLPYLGKLRTASEAKGRSGQLTLITRPDAGTFSGNFGQGRPGGGVAIVNAKMALAGPVNRTYFVVKEELHGDAYSHFRSELDASISRKSTGRNY